MAERARHRLGLFGSEERTPAPALTSSHSRLAPLDAGLVELSTSLGAAGFARVGAAALRSILTSPALADWSSFAASWDDLPVDTFMADDGRYRRRRFAVFSLTADRIARKPHQSHFQDRGCNPLNGGVERWFEPVITSIGHHPITWAVLRMCNTLFSGLTPNRGEASAWHAEIHQFRIEAETQGVPPTPEGLHRDGVDWIFMMLVNRCNVAGGATSIFNAAGESLAEFIMDVPLEAVCLDDNRVQHEVTPISPASAARLGARDMLVLTFRDQPVEVPPRPNH